MLTQYLKLLQQSGIIMTVVWFKDYHTPLFSRIILHIDARTDSKTYACQRNLRVSKKPGKQFNFCL